MPPNKIIGLGGALDSARFKAFIAREVGVSVEDVTAMVIGGHGDDMVPFVRYTSIAGIPLTKFLDEKKIEEIVNRTRNGGTEMVNLLKSGGAYYAPAVSILSMAESVLKDKKRVISCAAYLTRETGHHYEADGVFIGVPIVIGSNGVEKILNIDFTDKEHALWEKTVASVRKNCAKIDAFLST
jgi:malate dehydrogenase